MDGGCGSGNAMGDLVDEEMKTSGVQGAWWRKCGRWLK